MNCAREARKLAEYIISLGTSFEHQQFANEFSYTHIGALFADVILQAGLNYNSVVKPRVKRILIDYPEAYTLTRFKDLVDSKGLCNVIDWNHHVKLERFDSLVAFCMLNNIDTCVQLKEFLLITSNQKALLDLKGIGPKTVDYLMKLLSFDTIAVDRHIYSFVEMAEIDASGYDVTKRVVEYAADFLQIPRVEIDYSIWKYMSTKGFDQKINPQIEIDFAEYPTLAPL